MTAAHPRVRVQAEAALRAAAAMDPVAIRARAVLRVGGPAPVPEATTREERAPTRVVPGELAEALQGAAAAVGAAEAAVVCPSDRKSTRLNCSHVKIS